MQTLTSAQTERLPAEIVNERGIRLQQIVPVSVKNWQLKLLLKGMPAEIEMPGSECDRARHAWGT